MAARVAAPLASTSQAVGSQRVAPVSASSAPTAVSAAPSQLAQPQTLDTPATASSEIAPALVAASGTEVTQLVDQAIYTRANADVRPPRLVSEQLPTPAIGGWTTRTNAIEVLVSQDGTVEHARFVAAPQRMPDTFVLSRAKMWKFTPALKDGEPVRYRLVLTWEVNP
jgi:outer membrane biosynthesis protein TonB